jgi:prepilin-type N-terminal cleavage/methylation domain-containing protein
MRKRYGFTIVELLIVIVVIAILAAISIVAYNGIQQRARDNIRKSDLAQIEKSLELYKIDKGKYSLNEICSDTSYGGSGCGAAGGTGDWDSNSSLRELIPGGYMKMIPKDPINNSTYNYNYEPNNPGEWGYADAYMAYNLCATLEAGGSYCINKRP